MGWCARKEFDRRVDKVALSLHAQIAITMERTLPGAWQGDPNQFIQTLQDKDKGALEDGNDKQQAMECWSVGVQSAAPAVFLVVRGSACVLRDPGPSG